MAPRVWLCGSPSASSKCDSVVQAGAWDVDDTGLEYMPSQDIAKRVQQVCLWQF